MPDLDLRALLTRTTGTTTTIFRVFGGVCLVMAVILGVALVVTPTHRGEAAAKAVVGCMALGFGAAGVIMPLHFKRRGQRTLELALERPGDIAKLEIIHIRRGALHTWAVWMTDKGGTRVGTQVADEPMARAVVAQLRAAGAQG